MNSTSSGSDPVEELHRGVLRWLHRRGWRNLRPAQSAAIRPILGGRDDVIVSAPTAGGKTEAAFLPICSRLRTDRDHGRFRGGVEVICVSPLKALINDQHRRLEDLTADLDIPVHKWHGDVAASAKQRVRRHPAGILLITPESLEALFVTSGPGVRRLLDGLRYLVVDELHAFIGTERGAQLRSLLHRVEHEIGRAVPRVALSATLADPTAAKDFLCPGQAHRVTYLDPPADASYEVRVFGYQSREPDADPSDGAADGEASEEVSTAAGQVAIAQRLFDRFRGRHHLVFANSRHDVEVYTDRLTRMCARHRLPEEFLAHHGNLAKSEREHVEARMRRPEPATAICTATLEMGIDIGKVRAVGQIGSPPGVASLRQRMGRSGRTNGAPLLEMHIAEDELTERTHPVDTLRVELFQATAMIELMAEGWLEPPRLRDPHFSTLVQQILSVIAQRGGAAAPDLFALLCGSGPFNRVDRSTFVALLRAMGGAGLIEQSGDGLLLAGPLGDRLINHYSFFTAFQTAQEFRVTVGPRTIGTLPVEQPLRVGDLIVLSGRRWRVVDIDLDRKLIQVTPSAGGRPPRFAGKGWPQVADEVRRRMRGLYRSTRRPEWLDDQAQLLLDQGRRAFEQLELGTSHLVPYGEEVVLFPWRGDTIMNTLSVVLAREGLTVDQRGPVLSITGVSVGQVRRALGAIAASAPIDAQALAASVPIKERDKYDRYLTAELLDVAYAAHALDVPNTWQAIRDLAGTDIVPPAEEPPSIVAGTPPRIGRTPLAVVDVETTGLHADGTDRVVEIAIVRVSPNGDVLDSWHTMINPGRPAGASAVHGLTDGMLRAAPTFAGVADEVLRRLSGAVVVGHNVDFDLRFLAAELRRSGTTVPNWPALCTLRAAYRLGRAGGRRLSDLCAEEGLPHLDAHSALGDAEATAALLGVYLRRALASELDFPDLAVRPVLVPPQPPDGPAGGRLVSVMHRPGGSAPASRVDGSGPSAGGDPRIDSYLELLDRVISDHHVTAREMIELRDLAAVSACRPDTLDEIHRRYVNELRASGLDIDRVRHLEDALAQVTASS